MASDLIVRLFKIETMYLIHSYNNSLLNCKEKIVSIEDMAVLCVKNGIVKQIVEEFSDDKVVEIDKAKENLGREHWEILNAFKAIVKTECAKLTIGRRGQHTRIYWTQDLKKIITNKPENIEIINEASLEELVNAIKLNHNVSSVHLVY